MRSNGYIPVIYLFDIGWIDYLKYVYFKLSGKNFGHELRNAVTIIISLIYCALLKKKKIFYRNDKVKALE